MEKPSSTTTSSDAASSKKPLDKEKLIQDSKKLADERRALRKKNLESHQTRPGKNILKI